MKSIALAVFSALLAAPVCADPIGMAAFVKGPVTVQQDGKTEPLKLLKRLEPNATVKVGAGGETVIILFGGSRYRLASGKTGTITPGGVTGGQKLANASGPSANAVKLLGNARVGAFVARPPSAWQRLLPKFPGYLELPTPTFTWTPQPNTAFYVFSLQDYADNIVWSVKTTAPTVTYPTDGIALLEKRPYLWRITRYRDTGKAWDGAYGGIVTFLNSEDAQTLSKQIAEFPATVPADDNTTWLLMAETYRHFGVMDRAIEYITDARLNSEPGIADTRKEYYEEVSPMARVLARQTVLLEPPGL